MKTFWNWLDGYKSIISAVIMQIINSDYISGLITNPELYMLIQGISALLFIGSVGHHIKKEIAK